MKKKKSLIAIITLILVAIVGATFAYYTSNTTFENVFNAGKYKVTLTEVFESPDNWVPGETVPKTVTAKNDGTVDAAVRISYTEQWLKEIDGVETDITTQVSPNPAIINFDNQDDWTSSNGYYYYKYILEPTDETSSFISGVTLDPNLDSVTCTGEGNTKTCEAQNKASGAKYKLTFTIQTIQYDVYKSEWNTNVEIIKKPHQVVKILSGTKGNLQPGDEIGIGETEDFYVISSDNSENGKTLLLAKYNLMVGYSDNINGIMTSENTQGYGLQSVEAVGGYNKDTDVGMVSFSASAYWDNEGTLISPYDANNASYAGEPYPYVYNNSYITAPDFSETCDEETNCYYTPGYSIAYYVELYKSKLIEMGLPNTVTGRLLSYEEAIELQEVNRVDAEWRYNSIIYNDQDYWLASPYYSEYYGMEMYALSGGDRAIWTFGYQADEVCGVRPVIEIPTNIIK